MRNTIHVAEESGTWVFVAPVKRLTLTASVKGEFRVDRVTFVTPEKLPRIRKRLGFPGTIAHFKKQHSGALKHIFSEGDAIAVQRLTGKGEVQLKEFLRRVREELILLSLSQLGCGKRRNNAFPVLSNEHPVGSMSLLMLNVANNSWFQPNQLVGRFTDLVLDELWFNSQKDGFFFDLLMIIRGEIKVARSWREEIRKAAILAGQSQCSSDLPQAFLWNMIAIELLLTRRGDSYGDSLPERAEAFIGWTSDWKLQKYDELIRELYGKRCRLVHNGERAVVEIRDLLFSDVILLNVLTNIVRHPRLFASKDDVIRFSNRVSAEHLLGIKSKTIPKTLTFQLPVYNEKDFEEF